MNIINPSTASVPSFRTSIPDLCTPLPRAVDELVINWHVTEACNFKCEYCYAHWESPKKSRDLIRDDVESLRLVEAIWDFFNPENAGNPLRKHLRWSNLRLNIAGGEPLIYRRHVARIAAHAKFLGMRVSIITNGSLFAQAGEDFDKFARTLDMVGFSIDSASDETNKKIGRVGRPGNTLRAERFVELAECFRRANPDITIKVNTVVNKFNSDEDLRPVIEKIRPNRWKIFRVLPVISDELAVSDMEFSGFVALNEGIETRVSVEDNREMLESYIMVDPIGRFFQNRSGGKNGYAYSLPITKETIAEQFLGVAFDSNMFASRY